jgi:hypothetical protein
MGKASVIVPGGNKSLAPQLVQERHQLEISLKSFGQRIN